MASAPRKAPTSRARPQETGGGGTTPASEGKASGDWWRWNDAGQLEEYSRWERGQRNGLSVTFFAATGKRQTEGQFKADKRTGVHKRWTEGGELWTVSTFVDDKETQRKVFTVTEKVATQGEVDDAWKKVRALEEEQKRMLKK
jgi:antitoxin component YwqK of YwqJK toxin-antitoxin module